MSLFLSDSDIAELTGIKRGRDGKTRAQLQCQFLREHGIPFIANIKGEPKVCTSYLEGGKQTKQKEAWKPRVLQTAA